MGIDLETESNTLTDATREPTRPARKYSPLSSAMALQSTSCWPQEHERLRQDREAADDLSRDQSGTVHRSLSSAPHFGHRLLLIERFLQLARNPIDSKRLL